jgi:hypothetical protein
MARELEIEALTSLSAFRFPLSAFRFFAFCLPDCWRIFREPDVHSLSVVPEKPHLSVADGNNIESSHYAQSDCCCRRRAGSPARSWKPRVPNG